MKMLAVITLSALLPLLASAKDFQGVMEQPQKVGEARLSMLFWDIYDATLIAPHGEFNKQGPFALSLTYLRDFDGDDIASRSVDEMRKLGMQDEMKLASWYQKMQQIFPDVKEGQTITGLIDKDQTSHFYLDDDLLGQVDDPEFSQWFFNIWLSEDTSEPKMRQQLLGLQK